MKLTKGSVFLAERSGMCGCKNPEKGKNLVRSRNAEKDHVVEQKVLPIAGSLNLN